MKRLLALVACCLMTVAAGAAEFAWIEGENPTTKNAGVGGAGWGNKQFLSEQSWLNVNIDGSKVGTACPNEGVYLGYDFQAPSAGSYEVWDRIGFEYVRSPFEWQMDNGPWQTCGPTDPTTDLMELQEWNEVAWIRLGQVDLTAGKHSLQIRIAPTQKEENGKQVYNGLLYCSDALCIYKGSFRPNLWHRPDEDWQTDTDRQAAEQVFQAPAAAPVGERTETPLDGQWQVCRYDEQEVPDRTGPTTTLPDAAQAYWMAIKVPGNKFEVRPELRFCHRLVYRTRVDVPAGLAGRSFLLRFPSVCMIASVLVNGQYCGFTKAPYALWECDVTKAVKPGQVNEVCVAIKDPYYAFSPRKTGKSCRMSFNVPVDWMGSRNYISQGFDFPVGAGEYGSKAGILETPSFVVAGGVYSADVFVKPSVKAKALGLEISLLNPSGTDRSVQVVNEVRTVGGAKAEKSWPAQEVTVPAGQTQVMQLTEPWESPRLWWPDDPYLYELVTTVKVDGKVADVRRTTFGFREWEWDGPSFKINGVPWQLFADTTNLGGDAGPEASIALWRKHGQNMWRLWGRGFGGLDTKQALDLMDQRGIVVRRSGIFDGQGANYLNGLTDNKELFDNWITQLTAQVKEERNHPSILIWSMENEITFINSRNLGQAAAVEPEIARAGREVMAVDPTRPVMVDGGNCLMDRSLPVNGCHYIESAWRDYPDEAYTLARALNAHVATDMPVWGRSPWQLMPDRPIFMGESFYARGSTPSAFAQFGGEGCFAGWGETTRVGVGKLAKMLAEGYRWHGVAATHFWMSAGETDLHYNSWQPVCVLCKEWNWTFGGGTQVPRTLKVFNNTHLGDPITVTWELTVDGKRVGGEKRVFELAPGGTQETTLALSIPAVKQRTAGEFVLTCTRRGKEVFREVKPVAVLAADGGPRPLLKAGELVVMDPAGTVKERLTKRGVAFTEAASLDVIPAGAKVVVVGKDALDTRAATDPRWVALAASGTRVLVLEQSKPLRFLAVPADLAPTDYAGRVAFAENAEHPAFAGLDQPDFFTWSGNNDLVYRNVYRKATRGAVSLAQCDEGLGYSALAECPVNEGMMVLCQMVVGEKLGSDPVAQRLFDNLLAYCATYKPVRKTTAVAMAEDSPAFRLLSQSGLQFDRAADVLSAVNDGKHDIVVFDATPDNLKTLAGAAAQVRAFADRGGWLMAWNVTPEGLADFNRLVGVEHVMRPFELERVTLPAVRDPLMSGVTVRDVSMELGEQIFPWSGDKYLVDDEFTNLVDLDDIAPFCEFPGAAAGDHAAAKAQAASWSRNAVNGFTSADAWKLIYYMSTASPKLTIKLPREKEITRFSIVLNLHYAVAQKVNLYFDNDPTPVTLTTKPSGERQDFDIPPQHAKSTVTIELADFNKPGVTTGIDNFWLGVARTADWRAKVKPLLNIGGLVKYPMGRGGLVLNQLSVKDNEPVPDNAQKKRAIMAALLRNLHAVFAGGGVLTTAGMNFQPIPLEDQCNQYLTKDRGWYEGGRDLSHIPHGNVTFAGVPYVIRDFKTSPVPSCLMLAGPGAQGQLPDAVPGLAVGAKADALFFLHTMNRVADWRPSQPTDAPPVMFAYVVHYADGSTAQVPVVYGEGADNWMSKQPAGLKGASVAWTAPFPGDESGDQAVVYQMQWTNPKPEVEITTVDMVYGAEGNHFGPPALLALTAGATAK